jgi:hypothetical protein
MATKKQIDRPAEGQSRATRTERTPVGRANRLVATKRPGFVSRWVNDIEDRITIFLAAGYTFVTDPNADKSVNLAQDPSSLSSRISRSVGGGTQAYLMEIPEEYYKEDQLAKQKEVDEIDAQIKEGGKRELGHAGYGEGVSIK